MPALIGVKRLVLGAHPIPKLNPMSHASRSATPNRAVRAPRSPLSVSSASTNEPPAGETTPIAPPTPAEECCCVCLERLSPAAQGAQLAVPFPACSRHSMHLECLAQYRAQASGPADLLCPLCRHGQCPDCVPGGWSGEQDALLRALCRRHGLAIPERLSGESTVREAIRDYTLRTFTSSDAWELVTPEHDVTHGDEAPDVDMEMLLQRHLEPGRCQHHRVHWKSSHGYVRGRTFMDCGHTEVSQNMGGSAAAPTFTTAASSLSSPSAFPLSSPTTLSREEVQLVMQTFREAVARKM